MTYEVTTIGNVVEGTAPCGACSARRGPMGMGSVEDFGWFFPALWPAMLARRAARGDASANVLPGTSIVEEIAKRLGLNPVAFALGVTGYDGIGEYWPAVRNVSLAAALAGAAYAGARYVRGKKRGKKHVR